MPEAELKRLQYARLKNLIEKLYERVPSTASASTRRASSPRTCAASRTSPSPPFTAKDDLRVTYPYGLLACPQAEIEEIHMSSGTTGVPSWTPTRLRRRVLGGGDGPHAERRRRHSQRHRAELLRLRPLHRGPRRALRRQAHRRQRHSDLLGQHASSSWSCATSAATILTCTPSYSLYIAEEAREAGMDLKTLKLRAGCFGAEPWSENMRKEIEAEAQPRRLRHLRPHRDHRPGRRLRMRVPERPARQRGPSSIPRSSTPRRAGRCPTARRASSLSRPSSRRARRSSATAPATSRSLDEGPCACGRTTRAHAPPLRPHRRHAHHPRRERLPLADRARAHRDRGHRSALRHRGRPRREGARRGRAHGRGQEGALHRRDQGPRDPEAPHRVGDEVQARHQPQRQARGAQDHRAQRGQGQAPSTSGPSKIHQEAGTW